MAIKRTYSENSESKTTQEAIIYAALLTKILGGHTINAYTGTDKNGQELGALDETGELTITNVAPNIVEEVVDGVTLPAMEALKFEVTGGIPEKTYYVSARVTNTIDETIELVCRLRIDDKPIVFGVF